MKEGTLVYYIDEGQIHDGHVIDVETKQDGFVFSIDSYGECGGFCRIDSAQLNRTVFEDYEEAKKHTKQQAEKAFLLYIRKAETAASIPKAACVFQCPYQVRIRMKQLGN